MRPALAAYAAHGRLHVGDREELVERIVDDWWTARAEGEAVMHASTWRDVLELDEKARERWWRRAWWSARVWMSAA